MAYKRKYQQYKVVVTKENGRKEITDVSKYDVETDSFKDMIQAYNNIKEECKDQNIKIEFCGVSDNGQLDIMWHTEGKQTVQKNITPPKKKNIEEIVQDLKEIANILTEKTNSSSLESIYSKRRDSILHHMENEKERELDDIPVDEKVEWYNKVYTMSHKRRNEKELDKIREVLKNHIGNIYNLKIMIKDLENVFNEIKISRVLGRKKYSDENIDETIIKKISYIDDKDRLNKIRKCQRKYDRVKNDSENKMLLCYNKAKL